MNAPPASTVAVRSGTAYRTLASIGALVAAVMLFRLVVFAVSPAAPPAWSAAPWSEFITRHACSTAYWVAATSVGQAPDIYAFDLYSTGRDPVSGRLMARRLGAFAVDPYEYPPTFLPAPRALAAVTPDYAAFRSVWILLSVTLVAAGMVVVARRLDSATGSRSLWLVPLALAPLSTIVALQIGNAQLPFIVIATLALVAFERGLGALGGLLLAFVIVGKMFPGVLLLYLAVRRDWRAVAWTVGWAGVLGLATLAAFGWAPFAIFLDHLPRLLSGDAFPMLRAALTAANNQSVPGLVLKIPILGGPNVPFEALRITGWLYSALLLWATVRLALRPVAPRFAPLAWLTLLGLAALRSPFIPVYGAFPGVWIATMLLALCWHDARRRWAILLLFVPLLAAVMGPGVPPPVAAVFTTLQTGAVLVLMGMAVRVGREGAHVATRPAVPTAAGG